MKKKKYLIEYLTVDFHGNWILFLLQYDDVESPSSSENKVRIVLEGNVSIFR